MLEIKNLTGGWDATTVIENLSLSVTVGETISIIGRNGVGKTTLLELIVGRTRGTSGKVLLGDTELLKYDIYHRARLGIGYVPQQREVFPSLTVSEHLMISTRAGRWGEAEIFALFPGLHRRRDSYGRQLSGGEQQMLAIARALIGNPRVLLMDEPSEGLAPIVVEQLVESVKEVVKDGSLAVVIVEQRADIAIDLSSRCLIMDRGQIIHDYPSEELRGDTERIAGLMGLGATH